MAAPQAHRRSMMPPFATTLAVVLLGLSVPAFTADVASGASIQSMQDLQMAHIAANVPASGDFEAFLIRDLTAYFVAHGVIVPAVTYELLRDGPTQSGVAYPKYYVWAKASSSDGSLLEGVARLAAVDQTHFEITDFVTREQIVSQPDLLRMTVPAALFEATVERARRH